MTISENGYVALCKIREIKEVEVSVLTEKVTGFKVQNAVNSLKRGGLIEATKSVNRKITDARSTRVCAVSVYSITEKGHAAIRQYEAAIARKFEVTNPPSFRKITSAKKEAKKQELHPMQNWIIPERNPNVNVINTEINGHPVKVTYGVGHGYAPYKPAPDFTRYKPNPIKGILAQ